MTVATDIAVTASARGQPWRVLLWLAPLTALWIGLNYWLPGLQASGVPSTATRLAIHIAIVLGLWSPSNAPSSRSTNASPYGWRSSCRIHCGWR